MFFISLSEYLFRTGENKTKQSHVIRVRFLNEIVTGGNGNNYIVLLKTAEQINKT